MASLSFTHFISLPRWNSTLVNCQLFNFVQFGNSGLRSKWCIAARKKIQESSIENENVGINNKTTRTAKRVASRTRKKKAKDDTLEENSEILASDNESQQIVSSGESEASKKPRRRGRPKAASTSCRSKEEKAEKKVRGTRKTKKTDIEKSDGSDMEVSDPDESVFVSKADDESDDDIDINLDDGEDISHTYGWPPLVCCFGAAQHCFVPSGRRANRLIDYEIHDRMADALWAPEKFVRAPGGSAGSVAIALANLKGKVAFMGKLGDDEFGQGLLGFMNVNGVQTRSVKIDSKRGTTISHMKIAKRGRLRVSVARPWAEDALLKSEINIDVLKEAKIFYFNTHSLLDQSMRSTTLQAIKISKKLGGVIFYDVNLPLPLWQSSDEATLFIEKAWKLANIIEVTKQELEFLCGIKPAEEFDTKNNARSKFIHYGREMILPLWHDNLQVLFVTNGTSKIHYYTKEIEGAVLGMEDAPMTPFTAEMSASGDGIVAALMRMLVVQPHLITDKGYLERTIKYAIDCGVIDQWVLGQVRGFPPHDDMDEVEPDENGIRSITEKEHRTLSPVS